MESNVIPFPERDKAWDGDATQSRRWTDGQGRVEETGQEEAYADLWVEKLGLPPRLEGELWHQWAARTEKERNVGQNIPADSNSTEQETA